MKCIITLTIFSEDFNFIEFVATSYTHQVAKYLNYKVIKYTTGKHIDACRPHYHIMFLCDCLEGKIYKILNKKILAFHSVEFPTKEIANQFRDTEKKVSFIYEGEQKKSKASIINFSEDSMRYVFKEYDSKEKIDMEFQFGYTEEELEAYRQTANTEWRVVKEKRAKEIAKKVEEQDEFKKETEYLRKSLSSHKYDTPTNIIRRTQIALWEYKKIAYKQGKIKSVRVAGIKDKAISFLVFEGFIHEDTIVDLINNREI
jgi:hypothetical protein